MTEIKITRRMLNNGMQGRIKVCEIDRYNKLSEAIKVSDKKDKTLITKDSFDIKEVTEDYSDMEILKKPKLRKVRTYRGWN